MMRLTRTAHHRLRLFLRRWWTLTPRQIKPHTASPTLPPETVLLSPARRSRIGRRYVQMCVPGLIRQQTLWLPQKLMVIAATPNAVTLRQSCGP